MGTARKLMVEVVDARELTAKDGQGTSSPYTVVDYHGQRKRTRTAIQTLHPAWNEVLEFEARAAWSEALGDEVEVAVFHDRSIGPTRRSNFLGRIVVSSRHFTRKGEEALKHYALESRSLFSWARGEIGLKIYHVDEPVEEVMVEEVPPPPAAPGDPTEEAVKEVEVAPAAPGDPTDEAVKEVEVEEVPPLPAAPGDPTESPYYVR